MSSVAIWLEPGEIYRGSYMSAHVLLILLNELGNFATSLINSLKHEHEC